MTNRPLLFLSFFLYTLCLSLAALGLFLPETAVRLFLDSGISRLLSPDQSISPRTALLLTTVLKNSALTFTTAGLFIAGFAWTGLRLRREQPSLPNALPIAPMTRQERWTGFLIVTGALLIRWPLMSRSFSYDEIHALLVHLNKPISETLVHFKQNMHLGYNILSLPILHLWGAHEWSFRLPALLMGLTGIAALWLLGRRIVPPRIALLASALLAVSPAHAIWSASGRGYSGYILCALLCVFLYLRLLDRPSIRLTSLFMVSCIVGQSMHAYFLFFPLALSLHLMLSTRLSLSFRGARHAWNTLGAFFAAAVIIFLPLTLRLWVDLASRHSTDPDIRFFPVLLWQSLLSIPFWPMGLLLLMITITGGIFLHRRCFGRTGTLWGALLLLPILIWLSRPYFMYPRFWAGLLPFIFLLMSAGIASLTTEKHMKKILFLSFLIVTLVMDVEWAQGKSSLINDFSDPFRETAAWVKDNVPGSTSVCAAGEGKELFQYYADRPITTIADLQELAAFQARAPQSVCLAIPALTGIDNPSERAALDAMIRMSSQIHAFKNIGVFQLPDQALLPDPASQDHPFSVSK